MGQSYEPPFSWTCGFCGRPTTINRHDIESSRTTAVLNNSQTIKVVWTRLIACPNPDCHKVSFIVELYGGEIRREVGIVQNDLEKECTLVPSSKARHFPEYVPQAIREDYLEACEIVELSPKASATLARRALQGMIRDFWGIRKSRLKDEIDELRDRLDATTWEAVEAVRNIGNIGAHMEKDVNLMVYV